MFSGVWDDIKTFHPDMLKVDSLILVIPDSLLQEKITNKIQIKDSRSLAPDIIDIHQTKKLKYIPVDQLIISKPRLDSLILRSINADSVSTSGTLYLKHLNIWYDSKPWFNKGHKLNAYTLFNSNDGAIAQDWLWEISLKRKKKEKQGDYFTRLILELGKQQGQALINPTSSTLYPFEYRRRILSWSDFMIFPNAYGVNIHFTIDYPADQMNKYFRGSPGIFFRKSKKVESISVGGKRHQSWNWRYKNDFLIKSETGIRFGFNNYNRDYYNHLDFWELFNLQMTWENSLLWRPRFHKGIYGGIGIVQIIRALPTVLPIYEPGFMLTIGVSLP